MGFECIRSETTEDGVLVLTLNDPATRNALGPQLSAELEGEVDRCEQDSALRVLVITGADPAFCSGANVRGFNRAVQQREAQGSPPPPSPGSSWTPPTWQIASMRPWDRPLCASYGTSKSRPLLQSTARRMGWAVAWRSPAIFALPRKPPDSLRHSSATACPGPVGGPGSSPASLAYPIPCSCNTRAMRSTARRGSAWAYAVKSCHM